MEPIDVTVNCALLQSYIKSHQGIHCLYIHLRSTKSPPYHVDTEKVLCVPRKMLLTVQKSALG